MLKSSRPGASSPRMLCTCVPEAWDQSAGIDTTLQILRDLALSHCADIAHSETREWLCSALRQGRWHDLLSFECDYLLLSVSDSIHVRQVLGFFSKLEDLDIGVDKSTVALDAFIRSEVLCRETNDLFHLHSRGRVSLPQDVASALLAARRKIWDVLGRCPDLSELDLFFGPGATTNVKRRESTCQSKMAGGLVCSEDLLASGRLPAVIREIPHYAGAHALGYGIDDDGYLVEYHEVSIAAGKLEFVPKNAKTYRSIVVEPTLNTMLQHGIGEWMARRLRSFGVDIRDQTANQRLARVGSLTGAYATIDLSSASDTIAKGLVKYLLPPKWHGLLSAARTSKVYYKDTLYDLAKFSSMGNGYTFPLETLLFWALADSVAPGNCLAYGDDIIIPTEAAESLIHLLTTCGFVVNRSKSFWTGPFRESCGADFLGGINIRPFYQKHLVSARTLFVLHNRYMRDFDYARAAIVAQYIPRSLRLYGPDGYGDGHLISDRWHRIKTKKTSKNGYGGSFFETFALRTRSVPNLYPGDWVSPLYTIYARAEVPLSDSVAGIFGAYGPVDTSDPVKRAFWTLPGSNGYKKELVYTFS